MCWLTDLFKSNKTDELPSPRVAIKPEDIVYNPTTQAIEIKGIKPPVWITTVAGTNSMEPTIDIDHYVICSNASEYLSEDTLKVGDVIVYQASENGLIIHSIIEIGRDADGWYCIAQGWNNSSPDPQKIRLADIKWVVLLVIWSGKEDEP